MNHQLASGEISEAFNSFFLFHNDNVWKCVPPENKVMLITRFVYFGCLMTELAR